jgi:SAM-dependent methyltransferase
VDFANPSLLEKGAEAIAFRLTAFAYRRYARSLPLTGNERVLDFGCGGGSLSRFLAPRLEEGGLLVCYDRHPLWTRKARRRLGERRNLLCVSGDPGRIRVRKDFFDIAVVHFVLHDIPRPEREETVRLLARLLAPGGSLYIREPTRPSHGIDPAEVRRFAASAGLKERESVHAREFPLGMTFRGIFRGGEFQEEGTPDASALP